MASDKAVVLIDVIGRDSYFDEHFEGTYRTRVFGVLEMETALHRAESYARRVLAKGYFNQELGIGFPAHRINTVWVLGVDEVEE